MTTLIETVVPTRPGPAVADYPGAAEAESGRPLAEGGTAAEKGGL